MRILNICLVGFGNSGKAFCRLLIEKHSELMKSLNYDIRVTGICTGTRGNLLNTKGIDLEATLKFIDENGKFNWYKDYVTLNTLEVISHSKCEVMLELSTLSIRDGEPAITHIETALRKGIHVITANKGPIAWAFHKLKDLAAIKGVNFFYETTVMDGTPVFNLVRYSLPGCKVLGFSGILNSTTNFIIEEMEKGNTYDEAVKEAQRRGFAEADPSLDVEGWDAAAKVSALSNVLLNANISPLEVSREGIVNISSDLIKEALNRGNKIKLYCEAYLENGHTIAKVYPKEVLAQELYSTIDATSSVISIRTDLMGDISVIEKDPEILQTAYGIYSDLLNLIRELSSELSKYC